MSKSAGSDGNCSVVWGVSGAPSEEMASESVGLAPSEACGCGSVGVMEYGLRSGVTRIGVVGGVVDGVTRFGTETGVRAPLVG